MIDVAHAFHQFRDDEFLHFDRIENPPSKRRDLCAFILLDKLVPSALDIIGYAKHEEIVLEVDPYQLAQVATEDDIRYLVRCGVRYDETEECLEMFV